MALDVPDSKRMFQRKGSQNWYLRLVIPADMNGGRRKVVERSLGEIDFKAAELAAADQIKKHKALMLERRQARVARVVRGPWQPTYEPGLPVGTHTIFDGSTFTVLESGLYELPDGRKFIPSEHRMTFMDGTDCQNGGPLIYVTGGRGRPLRPSPNAAQEHNALVAAWDGKIGEGPIETVRPVVTNAKANPDDALLEDYIKFGAIKKKNGRGGKPLTAAREKEARRIWATFKQVVDKPLKDCTYDDGVALVAHIEAEHQKKHGEPIKAATVQRTLVPLIALVTRAQVLKKFTGANPFLHVGSNGAASDIVDGFSDSDLATIRKHLGRLDKADQLLLRMAACTGMDRGELFGIKSEATEDGVRYCTIAKGKTDARPRRVPFPTSVLKHLPKKISKPLFTGRHDSASKRLGEFMAGIGIVMDKGIGEDGKRHVLHALHSFRHRAETRLNKAYPGADRLHNAIGGWTNGKKNARWTYGEFPLPVLKEAIDKIGGL